MTTVEFLRDLRAKSVHLWIDGERLRYSAPKGIVTADVREELRNRKDEIIRFLRKVEETSRNPKPAIERIARTGELPLSFAQERLWFVDQLMPGSPMYNMPGTVRLQGKLDPAMLAMIVNELVRRHETLRTTFTAVNGEPRQIIADRLTLDIPAIDLQELPETAREPEVERLARLEARKPFDLARGPLLRASLINIGPEEHIGLFTMHHIVSDGWSMGVLIRELAVLHEAFSLGRRSPLPELPIQYADFAAWQRARLLEETSERQLAYWTRHLAGSPELELPTDRARPATPTHRGAYHSFVLPKALAGELRDFSQRENVTLFMSLLGGYEALLHVTTGQEDLVLGTDVASRNRRELEGLIGFFVNILPLRTHLSGDLTFRELLAQIRKTTLDAYAHQDLPFSTLIEALRPARVSSQTPLVQGLFVLENVPRTELQLPGLSISPLQLQSGIARFDLALFMREERNELIGTWNYSTDLFSSSRIEQLTNGFETTLRTMVREPDLRLASLELRDKKERVQKREQETHRLRKVRRRSIDISQMSPVRTYLLSTGSRLPLVVSPAVPDADLIDWAGGNAAFIEQRLHDHGALLFRGFDVNSVSEFERFALAIVPELYGEYGDLPHEGTGKIYLSTPYPPEATILFHNESSHMDRWPLKQWFYCVKAAANGGETPIVDGRQMYARMDPDIRKKFQDKGILYVRNFKDQLDVQWQDFFHTMDRTRVEEACRRAGTQFEWQEGGGLSTRKVGPAIMQHPKTGETVWFNQIQHWHLACLDRVTRESLLELFGESGVPRHCYYGDGSPIETEVVDAISSLYWDLAVRFPWQEHDILMIDNVLVAHARNPFSGERKITVALGEMVG